MVSFSSVVTRNVVSILCHLHRGIVLKQPVQRFLNGAFYLTDGTYPNRALHIRPAPVETCPHRAHHLRPGPVKAPVCLCHHLFSPSPPLWIIPGCWRPELHEVSFQGVVTSL